MFMLKYTAEKVQELLEKIDNLNIDIDALLNILSDEEIVALCQAEDAKDDELVLEDDAEAEEGAESDEETSDEEPEDGTE